MLSAYIHPPLALLPTEFLLVLFTPPYKRKSFFYLIFRPKAHKHLYLSENPSSYTLNVGERLSFCDTTLLILTIV